MTSFCIDINWHKVRHFRLHFITKLLKIDTNQPMYWPFLLESWRIKPLLLTAGVTVCGALRMRQVSVYGSDPAARRTLEFKMFKHVFLTGPPGKHFPQVSGADFLSLSPVSTPLQPCQVHCASYGFSSALSHRSLGC